MRFLILNQFFDQSSSHSSNTDLTVHILCEKDYNIDHQKDNENDKKARDADDHLPTDSFMIERVKAKRGVEIHLDHLACKVQCHHPHPYHRKTNWKRVVSIVPS